MFVIGLLISLLLKASLYHIVYQLTIATLELDSLILQVSCLHAYPSIYPFTYSSVHISIHLGPSHSTQYNDVTHPLTHHPMAGIRPMQAPMITAPIGPSLPNMMPSQQQHSYQWIQQSQPIQYNHPAAHLPPRAPISMQTGYLEHPTPIKPPPPYGAFQGNPINAGLIAPTAQHYHPQQPLSWNIPEYQQGPSAPQMSWGMGGAMQQNPAHQYNEYVSAGQYSSVPLSRTAAMLSNSQLPIKPQATNKFAPHPNLTQGGGQHDLDALQQQLRRSGVGGALPRYPIDLSERYPYSQYSQRYEDISGQHGGSRDVGFDQMKVPQVSRMFKEQDDNGRTWSHDSPRSGYSDGYSPQIGGYIDPHPRLVEVKRNVTGSLGFSLGQIEGGGVAINAISQACLSSTKGQLNIGDRILDVGDFTLLIIVLIIVIYLG